VNNAGKSTITVPFWPGWDGTATVEVVATEPKYSEETVVNSAGT
jgi:hypothetical protein